MKPVSGGRPLIDMSRIRIRAVEAGEMVCVIVRS